MVTAVCPRPAGFGILEGGMEATVVSVNVGQPRTVEAHGQTFTTAIWKSPVDGRRRVADVNVDGDRQADLRVHGGPSKSLYVYAVEDYRWWERHLGRPLAPGTFGENLTVEGVDLTAAVIGERWEVGSAVLRVTEPRIPCFKLGIRMDDRRFPARFAAAARPGTYLAIEGAGDVGAGDIIRCVDRPAHGVTIGTIERAYHHDRALARRLLDVDELSDGWREWAHAAVQVRRRAV
jgi:MOSC domain-containing protein YiiM